MSEEKKAIIGFTIWMSKLRDTEEKDLSEDLKKIFDDLGSEFSDEDEEVSDEELITPLVDYFLEKIYTKEVKEEEVKELVK